ncbi:uncharacterized protein [Palaemon carinicauda]|uniref:uncharacterized protein n=1 Tax=Palaemon carinicauda TaxID=392227 RepID=UPI0035B616D2
MKRLPTHFAFFITAFIMMSISATDPEEWNDSVIFNHLGIPMASPCNDRKCLKYYKGQWSTDACPGERVVSYCSETNKYCCARNCTVKDICTTGACVKKKSSCPNGVLKDGCGGKMCFCCNVYSVESLNGYSRIAEARDWSIPLRLTKALDFASESDCEHIRNEATHRSGNCLDLVYTDFSGVKTSRVGSPVDTSDHAFIPLVVKTEQPVSDVGYHTEI